jgi:AraC-like DNA-binding protein
MRADNAFLGLTESFQEDRFGTSRTAEDRRCQVNGCRRGAELFDWWHEEVCATFVPLDAVSNTCDGVGRFIGGLTSGTVGALRMCAVSGREVDVRRTRAAIRRSDPGLVKVGLQLLGGGVVVQHEREATLCPGDFVVYDTSEPYALHFMNDFAMFVVMIPRASLKIAPKSLAAVTAVTMHADQGAGSLVSPFLWGLLRGLIAGTPRSPMFEDAVVDLVSAALDEKSVHTHGSPAVAIVSSAKSFIDAQLGDPDLNTSTIAAAHHITPRYLQKLFKAEDLTVAGWIRTRRLQRCRRDLEDPRQCSVSIGSICARRGFADPAYFSRLFKQTYGVSPRAFRQRPRS